VRSKRTSSRARTLQQKYGISEEQWDWMYNRQKGLCPICQKLIQKPGNKLGKRAAAVDHDHKTGRVRGLTCYRCNRFKIGRNTTESITRLYHYLTSEFDGRYLTGDTDV
jgi:hypothetical protein